MSITRGSGDTPLLSQAGPAGTMGSIRSVFHTACGQNVAAGGFAPAVASSNATADGIASVRGTKETEQSLSHACTVSARWANTARQVRKHRATRNLSVSTSVEV